MVGEKGEKRRSIVYWKRRLERRAVGKGVGEAGKAERLGMQVALALHSRVGEAAKAGVEERLQGLVKGALWPGVAGHVRGGVTSGVMGPSVSGEDRHRRRREVVRWMGRGEGWREVTAAVLLLMERVAKEDAPQVVAETWLWYKALQEMEQDMAQRKARHLSSSAES